VASASAQPQAGWWQQALSQAMVGKGVLTRGGVLPAALAKLWLDSVRYLSLRGRRDERLAAILDRIRPCPALAGARAFGTASFAPSLVVGAFMLWICSLMVLLVFNLLTC
jgi:hypothetical protein